GCPLRPARPRRPLQSMEGDVIRGGKLKCDQGFLKIPEGPGLGVELDPDLLKHYELTEEKMAPHHRHIEAIRERHLDALGWQQGRTGWPRYRDETAANHESPVAPSGFGWTSPGQRPAPCLMSRLHHAPDRRPSTSSTSPPDPHPPAIRSTWLDRRSALRAKTASCVIS
ncbi:MAG: hypothetical protein VCF24_00245, partial [Candidatus Latescibacterota bacterium]